MAERQSKSRRNYLIIIAFAFLTPWFVALNRSAQASDATAFYEENCKPCHTIGGGNLVGPDLKDVTKRKDREWLIKFIIDPQAALNSGDPYVLKLKEESGGMEMPTIPGIDRGMAEALLNLIEGGVSSGREAKVPEYPRTLSPQDVEKGKALFMGEIALKNSGPACVSCHTMRGTGRLGGGKLGPDLSRVVEKMKGQASLSAWLASPPSAFMRSIYKGKPLDDSEIAPIVAYLDEAAGKGDINNKGRLYFFILGLGGALAGVLMIEWTWRNRFRSVRREIVENARYGASGNRR